MMVNSPLLQSQLIVRPFLVTNLIAFCSRTLWTEQKSTLDSVSRLRDLNGTCFPESCALLFVSNYEKFGGQFSGKVQNFASTQLNSLSRPL